MRVDSPFLATIREPLLALRPIVALSSVKKYRLGTSKCHDHDFLTVYQPIRLQHLERSNENQWSEMNRYQILFNAFIVIIFLAYDGII